MPQECLERVVQTERNGMLEGSYGKEPFDLRLTVLRAVRCYKWILGLSVAGTVLFTLIYCACNLWNQEKLYEAASLYHVEYAVKEEKEVGVVYINAVTWNTYLSTDLVLDALEERLDWKIAREELQQALSAELASDLRMPSTKVTMKEKEQALLVAAALETVMQEIIPANTLEVDKIDVILSAKEAVLVERDVRAGRAVILGAILSVFFVLVFFLLWESGEDAIWLPHTIRVRYGKRVLGSMESKFLAENLRYLFAGKKRVAICPVQPEIDPKEVLQHLRKKLGDQEEKKQEQFEEWIPYPSPVLCPEECGELRSQEGILLVVRAGRGAGKQLEAVLQFLREQDCEITGVLLWQADEGLLKSYYCFTDKKETE